MLFFSFFSSGTTDDATSAIVGRSGGEQHNRGAETASEANDIGKKIYATRRIYVHQYHATRARNFQRRSRKGLLQQQEKHNDKGANSGANRHNKTSPQQKTKNTTVQYAKSVLTLIIVSLE